MLTNDMRVYVGQNGVLEGRVLVVGLLGEDPPPLLDFGALLLYNLLLLDQVQRLGLPVDERLFEGLVVDFLQDGLQGVQRLLQHLVPVRVRNRCDDGDEQGEGGVLLGLQNGQELVILEEAHRPIGHLQLRAGNALNQTLEQLLDQGLQPGDFAHLEHLQHFGEEHDFLGRVAEGPVAQQSLHQQQRQLGVLAQEKHRAAQQLLVVEVAGLHFVQGDDHRLEEVQVLLAQGHREPADYGRQDVQELRGAVELEVLVGQRVEGVRDGLADHLAARDQLGVEPVQDVLEVLALARLLGVEQLQELLDEGVRDENAQRAHLRGLVHNQLQEEVVDRLQVRPGGSISGSSRASTPVSAGAPPFLRMGRGRKMFLTIISITRSRWGITSETMQFCSLSNSCSSARYCSFSFFSLMLRCSSLKSNWLLQNWTFFRNWSRYSLGTCLGSVILAMLFAIDWFEL